jgi:hypothetical protein
LQDDGAASDLSTANHVADLHADHITAAKVAVERKIEHRAIAKTAVLVKKEANRPDLLRLQRSLGTDLRSCVSCTTICGWRDEL